MQTSTAARAPGPSRRQFGVTPEGVQVDLLEIASRDGARAAVITLGATLQSLTAPDRRGQWADIVLGHDNLTQYVETPLYLGASIGRFSNRIANGRFTLDGKTYDVEKSDGENTLHGGMRGFDKVVWEVVAHGPSHVTLRYQSPDADQGFPGALDAKVTYRLNEGGELAVSFEATTDAPTVCAMTHHSYFNLAGQNSGASIDGHRLTIDADTMTPVNSGLIPTGVLHPVAGTPFDFRESAEIGPRLKERDDPQLKLGGGFDHNFAVRGGRSAEPKFRARLEEPKSGRVMEIFSDAPALQFYSGQYLGDTLIGKGGAPYNPRSGLCLEPQEFPDAPNQPAFPSTRLAPGETYRHEIRYRFSVK